MTAMKCRQQIYAGVFSFAQLCRSEYMLAGRVPGLWERQEITLDRKNSTADETVILA